MSKFVTIRVKDSGRDIFVDVDNIVMAADNCVYFTIGQKVKSQEINMDEYITIRKQIKKHLTDTWTEVREIGIEMNWLFFRKNEFKGINFENDEYSFMLEHGNADVQFKLGILHKDIVKELIDVLSD